MDGFVAGPEIHLDWMTWEMDEKLIAFINHLTDTSDTILLGRKMTEGFMSGWEAVRASVADLPVGTPGRLPAGRRSRLWRGPLRYGAPILAQRRPRHADLAEEDQARQGTRDPPSPRQPLPAVW